MPNAGKATEPNGSDEALLAAGLVWTAVCLMFLAVACWRAWNAYTLYRRIGAFEHRKMRVHGFLVSYGILDVIYGLSFAANRGVDKGGYAVHMIAIAISTLAMCQIPLLWSQIMDYGGYYGYVKGTARATMALITCAASSYVISIIYYGDGNGETLDAFASLNSAAAGVVTVSLSTWLVVYGTRMYMSLSKTQATQTNLTAETRAERMRYIRRALYLSIGLSFCYVVRGSFIICLFITRYSTTDITSNLHPAVWILMALLFSCIFPGCLMLYICTPSSVKFIKHGTNVRARFLETDAPEGQAVAVTRVLTDDSGIYSADDNSQSTANPIGIEMESGYNKGSRIIRTEIVRIASSSAEVASSYQDYQDEVRGSWAYSIY